MSFAKDLEDDGDAMHELHRRVWPVFEKLLLNRPDNPRKMQKQELTLLRVYFKTLPARLWVVQCKKFGPMASSRLGLPLPISDLLIEEIEKPHLRVDLVPSDQTLVDLLFIFLIGLPLCLFAADFAADKVEEHERIIVLADNAASLLWPGLGSARLQIPMRKVTNDYHEMIESVHVERITKDYDSKFDRIPLWNEDESYRYSYDFGMQGNHFVGCECYDLRLWADKQSQDLYGLIVFKSQDNGEGPFGHVHGGLLATVGDVVTAYAALANGVMTQKLEISYRTPVPLKSVLRCVGGKRHNSELRKDSILTVVEFFDVRDNLKFVAKGTFTRPRIAKM